MLPITNQDVTDRCFLGPLRPWFSMVRHVLPPEHVLETVAIHNEIVRWLVTQHKGVLFVDQASLMAGSSHYFNDPCHFTVVGSSKFVEHLLRVLVPSLKSG
jgi:hypothetical protein